MFYTSHVCLCCASVSAICVTCAGCVTECHERDLNALRDCLP